MELIPIIYNILLFGIAILICVIIISLLMNKGRVVVEPSYYSREVNSYPDQIVKQNIFYDGRQLIKEIEEDDYQQNFQIRQFPLKESQNYYRPTIFNGYSQETYRIEKKHLNKTYGDRKRYKIVNDEAIKLRSHAVNYY